MPSTAEENIYTRLAAATLYHPASANLFVNDWGLETGDVVTVKSGEDSYSVPIYSMNYSWTGGPTGDGSGVEGRLEIQSTGNQERAPLPSLRRKRYAAGASAYRATLPQMIVQSINESGDTELTLNADRILLGGDTTLAGVFTISNGALIVDPAAIFSSNLTILSTGSLKFNSSTPSVSGTLTGNNVPSLITDLRITLSGNTYSLDKKTVGNSNWSTVDTFSRATSLSGSWSGGTYTVTATPQGETISTTLATSDISLTRDGTVSQQYIHSGAVQVAYNFGLPDNGYGYYQFHVTVKGVTKWYYFSFNTRSSS